MIPIIRSIRHLRSLLGRYRIVRSSRLQAIALEASRAFLAARRCENAMIANGAITSYRKGTTAMATTAENLANAEADIQKATTVLEGATAYVRSVPGMIRDAVAAAIADGATAGQVQVVSDLANALEAKADAFTAALSEGTTPTPTP
jgi:hypothetical protein